MPCSPIQQLGRAGHTQRNKNKQIKSKTSDSNSLSKEGQMVGWNRQIRQNWNVFCRVLVLVCQFWFPVLICQFWFASFDLPVLVCQFWFARPIFQFVPRQGQAFALT